MPPDFEALLRRVPMRRLCLTPGIVGDYDGAYEWIREDDHANPDCAVGEHPSAWPGESYTVIEVPDFPAMAQAVWEAVEEEQNGLALYHALARTLIARILDADAKCDPPCDVGLRLESIIRERNALRAERDRLAQEVERLRKALVRSHPNVHGHEGWELCDICAALTPPDAPRRE